MNLTDPTDLPLNENVEARSYWARRGFRKSYATPMAYRTFIAEHVVAEAPRRVLEYGCNVGLNLSTIQALSPGTEVVGIDINPVAVDWGQKQYGLDLRLVADGTAWCAAQPEDGFDVAFTVSVIDHVAEPEEALRQLARMAPVLLLIEPWFGKEGKVSQADIPGTAPFSYSWDYPKRLGALGYDVTAEPYILDPNPNTLGPHYVLYTCRRREQAEVVDVMVPEPVVLEPEPVATEAVPELETEAEQAAVAEAIETAADAVAPKKRKPKAE